ncbi:hypothetical protein [Halomonas sp. CSM-2]|uniref:hypothetical protein n=1 Tax=Halomonas sp. CSM-2 TaxID=1975722 RepID=UPI000A280B3E|nr:hypothetical protein [Halomonas sp. CSM-2]
MTNSFLKRYKKGFIYMLHINELAKIDLDVYLRILNIIKLQESDVASSGVVLITSLKTDVFRCSHDNDDDSIRVISYEGNRANYIASKNREEFKQLLKSVALASLSKHLKINL